MATKYTDEDLCLDDYDLKPYEALTVIQTIDLIRELREKADDEGRGYDPCGYNAARAARLREYAQEVEDQMHVRLGWFRAGKAT